MQQPVASSAQAATHVTDLWPVDTLSVGQSLAVTQADLEARPLLLHELLWAAQASGAVVAVYRHTLEDGDVYELACTKRIAARRATRRTQRSVTVDGDGQRFRVCRAIRQYFALPDDKMSSGFSTVETRQARRITTSWLSGRVLKSPPFRYAPEGATPALHATCEQLLHMGVFETFAEKEGDVKAGYVVDLDKLNEMLSSYESDDYKEIVK